MAKNDLGKERYSRLRQLQDKLAAEYNLDRENADLRQLAIFELLSEGQLEAYLEGARIDLKAYLDLVRAKKEIQPPQHHVWRAATPWSTSPAMFAHSVKRRCLRLPSVTTVELEIDWCNGGLDSPVVRLRGWRVCRMHGARGGAP